MVRISDSSGQAHYLHKDAIAMVIEAGPSSQWHGIRSYVHTFNGKVIEAQEDAKTIAALIEAEKEPAK